MLFLLFMPDFQNSSVRAPALVLFLSRKTQYYLTGIQNKNILFLP
jgi:hypothetical protein